MLLLAIESSCDETAVAVLSGEPGRPARILASEISSQIELHRVYGGVVPEIASRNHSLHLRPLVEQALRHAGLDIHEMGGVRMGKDPQASLLNRWNQLHACATVFVTDGASMASTGTQNPSLTFMALAARAAH